MTAYGRYPQPRRMVLGGKVLRHNIERLLGALFLTNRNFATFRYCLGHSNGRCSRDVYLSTSLYWYGLLCNDDKLNIRIGKSVYISAWASTLLVQQYWAMRRPRFVGRVTGRIPRFLFCRLHREKYNRQLGIRWQSKKE